MIDTNVLVAGLRSRLGASYRLLELIGTGRFTIAVSVPLVFEYETALKRQSRSLGLTHQDVDDVLDYLCSEADCREIFFLWRPVLRDPGDDAVLEIAVEAQCKYIVTHNISDFVGSDAFRLEAMRPGEFLRRIGAP
ncbi:MAG TPA: putative toxin-antitoxin system toxin component, PIN family [Candidatus Methylomirabilis sp.]